ncbi:hypothetical protein H3U98_02865 [Bifidobacterium sp. W8116]|uniref:Uncharacterized protein n=1 Tax=Bifidobacterium choladohabitans TaxID=2750947 RepID=A0ABS0QZ59_9BIFI|nr:hypothetical protein [Bifidobacterium choladohabitans]MBI0143723.1 hypothetical protein [Bifidobacterium choladohabitans]
MRWNVGIFSGVILGQNTHGDNTLGFVLHSSGNYLVNMGSLNFARTLHGTYKLVLGVVVNAVVGLAYWVIYGGRPAVVFSTMVFVCICSPVIPYHSSFAWIRHKWTTVLTRAWCQWQIHNNSHSFDHHIRPSV